MLAELAPDWGLLLLRALVALAFGIILLVWPELTSISFVVYFGFYSLLDALLGLNMALSLKGLPGFGSFVFEAVVPLGAGVVALVLSGRVALALPVFLACWAGFTGIAHMATAMALRREMSGEWPLPIAGAASFLIGAFMVASPRIGLPIVVWLVGPYSILVGFALALLAVRLRHLAIEMAAHG
jgi:uncharacterized membrane protein HdeD (DUF308 family)